MTDNEINELGNEYANKVEYSDYVQTYDGELLHKNEDVAELIAKAHSDGIRKGIELALNILEQNKDIIVSAVTKAGLDIIKTMNYEVVEK